GQKDPGVHLYGHKWQSQKGRPFNNFAMRVVLKLAEGLEISMGEKATAGVPLKVEGEEEEVPARIEEKGGHETEGLVLRFVLEKGWMKELPEAVARLVKILSFLVQTIDCTIGNPLLSSKEEVFPCFLCPPIWSCRNGALRKSYLG
ncbi:hypothetical protein Tco_0435595, partial [Tanacetum coccineum]